MNERKNLLILLNSFMYFTLLLSILCQNTLDFCITYTHTHTHTHTNVKERWQNFDTPYTPRITFTLTTEVVPKALLQKISFSRS